MDPSVLVKLALFGVLLASLAAHSGQTGQGIIFEVDDSELAGMYGRYVANGRVIALGVHMSSTFQTGLGDIYRAGVDLGISLASDRERSSAQVTNVIKSMSALTAENRSRYAPEPSQGPASSFPTLRGGDATRSIPTRRLAGSRLVGDVITLGTIPESSIGAASVGQLALNDARRGSSGVRHLNHVDVVQTAPSTGGVDSAAVTRPLDRRTAVPAIDFQPHFSVISRSDAVKEVKTGVDARIEAERSGVDVASGSRLESVAGVAQGIQVSGDGNTINNNVVMDVTLVSSDAEIEAASGTVVEATVSGTQTLAGGASDLANALEVEPGPAAMIASTVGEAVLDSASAPNAGISDSQSLYVETQKGVTISAGVVRDGLQVEIAVPDQGRLTQEIASGFTESLGAVRQFTSVPGHFNAVRNDLHLITVLENSGITARALDIAGTQKVLQSLNDIRRGF